MARIRSVKPEYWSSEQVMACSRDARLLFIGIWNFADDLGHIPNAPMTLKAQIFPGDDLTVENVRGLLDELSTNSLLSSYRVEGKEYFSITGWHHQKIDRPQKPKYPIPLDDNSSNDRRELVAVSEHISKEGAQTRARDIDERSTIIRRRVIEAFEKGNSPNIPDTSRVDIWLAQGFDPEIIVAVIAEGVKRKPSISSLNYFDNAIREATERKNPAPAKIKSQAEKEVEWEAIIRRLDGERARPYRTPSSIPADFVASIQAKIDAEKGDDLDIPQFLDRRGAA